MPYVYWDVKCNGRLRKGVCGPHFMAAGAARIPRAIFCARAQRALFALINPSICARTPGRDDQITFLSVMSLYGT